MGQIPTLCLVGGLPCVYKLCRSILLNGGIINLVTCSELSSLNSQIKKAGSPKKLVYFSFFWNFVFLKECFCRSTSLFNVSHFNFLQDFLNHDLNKQNTTREFLAIFGTSSYYAEWTRAVKLGNKLIIIIHRSSLIFLISRR